MAAYVECVEPGSTLNWCIHDSCIRAKKVLMGQPVDDPEPAEPAQAETPDPRIEALRRVDMDYGRRNVGTADEEHWLRAECDCGVMLIPNRPHSMSNRDNLNLLDVVEAAMVHRQECVLASSD